MKKKKNGIIVAAVYITVLFLCVTSVQAGEECTIGVASGRATTDGRSLLWKTRDNSDNPDNEIYFVQNYRYHFVAVVNAGSTLPWMGVNEKGFAIVNSLSTDLPGGNSGMGNGSFMRYALGTCATVSELEHLLDSTNVSGRQTQANFGVIDSTGAAAIFETAADQYWKYDAQDSAVAPDGFVLRTNFAFNGGGDGGIERFIRSEILINDYFSGDTLNYKSILRGQMRDFTDRSGAPFGIPYNGQYSPSAPWGYVYTYYSICRASSVAAAVIHGVGEGEPGKLSTMWAMLGQPASTIAVPFWPVGITPPEANGYPTAPLCDKANEIKNILFDYAANSWMLNSYVLRDGRQGGLWTNTFPAEDSIITATRERMQQWRISAPPVSELLGFENALAEYAHRRLNRAYDDIVSFLPQMENSGPAQVFVLRQNFPNPFNAVTSIEIELFKASEILLTIYDMNGVKVKVLVKGNRAPGRYRIFWSGRDDNHIPVSSGCYFYRFEAGHQSQTGKMLLIR